MSDLAEDTTDHMSPNPIKLASSSKAGHLTKQQYYIQMPSSIYIAVWEGALKNYGPNMGYDYGGRLMAAWLDR